MARPSLQTVETLTTEDGDLTKALGETVEVDMPKAKVVHAIKIRARKGSLDTGSYDSANECHDLFENLNVQIADKDFWDVDGEVVKTLNQRIEESTTQDTTSPSGAGREATYTLYFADPVPVSKVSNAVLEINTRAISDISGGSQIASSPSTDLEISVMAMVTESGSFKDYNQVSRKPYDLSQGTGRVFEFNPSGDVSHLILHEDTADLSGVEVRAIYNGKDAKTVVDSTVDDLRNELRNRLSGTVTIPGGYTFIPTADIDNSALEELVFEVDVDTAGDVELFTNQSYTMRKAVQV
jgi:hypothetical protein